VTPLFAHRRAAGVVLADVLAPRLAEVAARVAARPEPPDAPAGSMPAPPLVLALPRGGVPVAAEVARKLDLPLEVLVVRKIGMPGRPELALGALGSGGARYLDAALMERLGVTAAEAAEVVAAESAELARREEMYRAGRRPLDLRRRVVVLVDDGVATGATMRAAALAVRGQSVAAVVAAAPVGPAGAAGRLADVCDVVVVARTPPAFGSVGAHYRDFSQTSDEEVRAVLADVGGERS
jgi:putative phosphoribosyl transferase